MTCICCGGSGSVPDVDGNPRPCSRCRAEDFDAWYAARLAAARAEAEKVGRETAK